MSIQVLYQDSDLLSNCHDWILIVAQSIQILGQFLADIPVGHFADRGAAGVTDIPTAGSERQEVGHASVGQSFSWCRF